jgi:hypothetical protein
MKRRILIPILIAILLTVVSTNVRPALADHGWRAVSASCASGTLTYTIEVNQTGTSVYVLIDLNGSFYKVINADNNQVGTLTFKDIDAAYANGAVVRVYNNDGDDIGDGLPTSVTASCGTACVSSDDRLNNECLSADETVAIYCRQGTLEFYAIYKGTGYFAFRITRQELARFSANPARNTLIKQVKGVRLYILKSGEYQVNRAKPDGSDYWFRWNPDLCLA